MSTLTQLETKVLRRTGKVAGDTLLTQAVRYEAINEALFQIALAFDWPWLQSSETISTVAGTATASTPTNFLRTASLVETSTGIVLTRRSIIELDQVVASGRPEIYHVDNATITFKPTPDAVYAYKHRFIRTEPALASGSDVALIPSYYDRGVTTYAAYILFTQSHEIDRALEAMKEYEGWLRRTADNINQSKQGIRIRVRPGSWF